jgi:hypothetical protein
MAARRAHRHLRWPGMGRAGRGHARSRRLLRFSARDLQPRRRRPHDLLPLHLAARLQRPAVDRLGMHRPRPVRGLPLAHTQRTHPWRTHPGRQPARRCHLHLRRHSALSQPQQHRAHRVGAHRRRAAHHRRRHRRRRHALPPLHARAHTRSLHSQSRLLRRTGRSHAASHLRLLGLLLRLLPRRRGPQSRAPSCGPSSSSPRSTL